jgi:hypothetical protein
MDASERLGLDREATEATLRSSSGDSFALGLLVGRMQRDPDYEDLVWRIGDKDLDVFDKVREPIQDATAELASMAREAHVNAMRPEGQLEEPPAA